MSKAEVPATAEPQPSTTAVARSAKVRTDIPIPAAPYLDRRLRDVPNLGEVWSYINPYMLYGRHLGFKGNFEKLLAEYRDTSKSATHEKWQKEFRARLAEIRAANPNPKILKDAERVEKAYELAGKLLESIRPAKGGTAAKKT